MRVERIVSSGQSTEADAWLVGARDEWVALLQGEAELRYEDGSRLLLGAGDHVVIPGGERHRVGPVRLPHRLPRRFQAVRGRRGDQLLARHRDGEGAPLRAPAPLELQLVNRLLW